MGRPRLHSDDDVLDAAREIILTSGVTAATIDAIARASGAPVGSLYHRFGSRQHLVAAMWLRAVRRSHESFLRPLETMDPEEAAVAAALSILDFCVDRFADAQLLVTLRQRDVLSEASPETREELTSVNEPVALAMRRLASRLTGTRPSARTMELLTLALVDLPLGAVRRHLAARRMPPPSVREPLEAAVRAALETLTPS